MDLARLILSVALALLLLFTATGKLLSLAPALAIRDQLKVHPIFWRAIGVLELAAVVGLVWGIWFVPFGLAAATGAALLMLGALGFRIRTHEREIVRAALADIAIFVLNLVVITLSSITLAR